MQVTLFCMYMPGCLPSLKMVQWGMKKEGVSPILRSVRGEVTWVLLKAEVLIRWQMVGGHPMQRGLDMGSQANAWTVRGAVRFFLKQENVVSWRERERPDLGGLCGLIWEMWACWQPPSLDNTFYPKVTAVVQPVSHVQLCDPMDCSRADSSLLYLSPGVCLNSCPVSRWCCLTISSSAVPFSFFLQSFPSIRVFSSEAALRIRWPKYWSFSFNTSRSNEYSGLISFRMDWLDLLAVQGTLKNLLQHHSSILQHSAFFIV